MSSERDSPGCGCITNTLTDREREEEKKTEQKKLKWKKRTEEKKIRLNVRNEASFFISNQFERYLFRILSELSQSVNESFILQYLLMNFSFFSEKKTIHIGICNWECFKFII